MTEPTVYPTVLHRLLAELEAVSPDQVAKHEPTDPIARNEQAIAPLSDSLRAMLALVHEKVDQHNALVGQHQAMHEAEGVDAPEEKPEPHQRIHAEIGALGEDIQILHTLLWRSIHEQFSMDSNASSVAIRAGWQVVDVYGGRRSGGIIELIFGSLLR